MIELATPGGAVARPKLSSRPPGSEHSVPPRPAHPSGARSTIGRVLLATWLSLVACSDPGSVIVPFDDPTPSLEEALEHAAIGALSGNGQLGEVGSPLLEPVIVSVLDSAGNPLEGAPVEWVFVDGSGQPGAGPPRERLIALTNAAGLSTMRWWLGVRAGTQSASAHLVRPSSPQGAQSRSDGGDPAVSFAAVAAPGPVDSIIVSPDTVVVVMGDSVALTADVHDQFGNIVATGDGLDWSTDDTTVARISADGVVWASGVGVTLATVTYDSLSAAIEVTALDSANAPPTVSILAPSGPTTLVVGDTVDFEGSAGDVDGEVTAHLWRFGDGATAVVEDPGPYAYTSTGAFVVTYQATDDAGATSVDSVLVTVLANAPPTASIDRPSADTTVSLGQPVQFEGSADDADGNVVGHAWDFGDGVVATSEDPGGHTYVSLGSFTVSYQVTDDQGATSAVQTRTVTVAAPNVPPLAQITSPVVGTTAFVGDPIDFEGTSSDPDGSIVSHAWDFGDGGVASVEDPGAYSYNAPGSYVVTYRAQDDRGDAAVDSLTIVVTSANPRFLFHSDWSTDTGSGFSAVADAAKAKPWTTILDIDTLLEVVPTASLGLDFPTDNVLQVTADDLGGGNVRAAQPQFRSNDGYIPIPNVGESLFYRYYLRVEVPDSYSADPLTHGTQDADDFGQRNWQHELVTARNGTYDLRISVTNGASTNPWPDSFWRVTLQKHTTYRIEQRIRRVASGQFTMHARIYDASGALVYHDPDFENADASATLADGLVHNFGTGGAAQLNAFRTGLNGLGAQSGVFPFTFAYIGGVAICADAWCGPYQGM